MALSSGASVATQYSFKPMSSDDDSIASLLSDIQMSYSLVADPQSAPTKAKLRESSERIHQAVGVIAQKMSRLLGLVVGPILLMVAVASMSYHQRDSVHVRRHSHRLPEILSQSTDETMCREHAIVYFVEKEATGSYGNLLKSLDLLYEHYLNQFYESTHVMLFHLGDFGEEDLQQIEWRYDQETRGTIQLINLSNTEFWKLPETVEEDDATRWLGTFSLHQRHKHRWFSNKIWDYFERLNQSQGCNYRYIMRMEMDSYIYSDIQYNMHQFMALNSYQYGYRLCSYEMESSMELWKDFYQFSHHRPNHHWDNNECAFHNNFFVADLQFMKSRPVQRFLNFVENGGYLYRQRINDAVIHTIIAYAYAPTSMIHRFLDFTYEHFTKSSNGCPKWGGLQAGYNDINGDRQLDEWVYIYIEKNSCPVVTGVKPQDDERTARIHYLHWEDLSPTYSHLPDEIVHSLSLKSVTAGDVDLPSMGVRSG